MVPIGTSLFCSLFCSFDFFVLFCSFFCSLVVVFVVFFCSLLQSFVLQLQKNSSSCFLLSLGTDLLVWLSLRVVISSGLFWLNDKSSLRNDYCNGWFIYILESVCLVRKQEGKNEVLCNAQPQ